MVRLVGLVIVILFLMGSVMLFFAVKADSTWETDQFLVNAYVGCKVVRLLSRDGVPY